MVPPILLFEKAGTGADVVFRGLLVPGASDVQVDEQLVAIWRSSGNQRFQNYRAVFSVHDVRTVSRAWLDDLAAGQDVAAKAPDAWQEWRRSGAAPRLRAPRSLEHRTREEQLPGTLEGMAILSQVHRHFEGRPHDFEHCAAQLWMMLAPATDELEVTRPSRDGGRDAVGRYRIGPPADLIKIDFALEAKCYSPNKAVGVREVSRLISRLRHRHFGVLVTTSYVHAQAYREIRDDQHPVAIVAGRDIVELLKDRGFGTKAAVRAWLDTEFPVKPVSQRLDVGWTADSGTDVVQSADELRGADAGRQ
jgi:hypothetical protein